MNNKLIQWVLRIAVAGEFLGHGVFALQGKEQWIGWVSQLTGMDMESAAMFILWVGVLDIIVALFILIKPIRIFLLWAVIWDFVERWANWGAPLALLLLIGWPKNWKEWFR